jgi:mannose-6-phosphate isomerase-like protein (cupin superfamily)
MAGKMERRKMSEISQPPHRIDVFRWDGQGYQPFVSQRGWLVALMNWEARFDPANVGQVERHNETDEVFVLTAGQGLLFVDTGEAIQVIDMQPGVIYNVTRGTWHGVLGTHATSWLIVESSDTNDENSDYRQLTQKELETLKGQYPAWLIV